IAERIGRDRLRSYFDNLGLTSRNPVELPESARPLLPTLWDDDAMLSASFGHGIMVTPVALAQAYSAIINGGMEVPLTIRKRTAPPPAGKRVVSPATSAVMLQIMRANVMRGTGKSAAVPGIAVGGKTGTGEKVIAGHYSTEKQVSSFAAAFPVNGGSATKRYFVLVLLDEPHGASSTGAIVAAPAVGHVIDRIAPFLGIARQDLTGEKVLGADGVSNLDEEEGEEGQ
ncbi:MAG: Peptidoglycan glycosyltransferase, partial [Caulobacteraceae bacterium]|nr:Peptidoglycan glycosyltransferase [Caulobacteraceae bacterium]